MSIDFFKALEGQGVYLVTTGNRSRRNGVREYRRAVITKVGRVNVTVNIGRFECTLRAATAHPDRGFAYLKDNNNGGFVVYSSHDAMVQHDELSARGFAIESHFRQRHPLAKNSIEEVRKICDILGIDVDEESFARVPAR